MKSISAAKLPGIAHGNQRQLALRISEEVAVSLQKAAAKNSLTAAQMARKIVVEALAKG